MIARFILFLFLAAAATAGATEYASGIKSISEAVSQVGKYPAPSGPFLRSECIQRELKRILGSHLPAFEDHLSASGCGALGQEGEFVVADISQLHVGGYSSLIYMDTKKETLYLFWLKGSVLSQDWQLYGDRPIPEAILRSVEARMNQGWGHVATFRFFGEYMIIKKKNEPTGSRR